MPVPDFILWTLCCDSFALEAACYLVGIESVAFHQHLNQTTDRFAFRRHDRTGTLELFVDQLSRRFLDFVEQTLAALLIRLTEMNRSETAHTKLADHCSR